MKTISTDCTHNPFLLKEMEEKDVPIIRVGISSDKDLEKKKLDFRKES